MVSGPSPHFATQSWSVRGVVGGGKEPVHDYRPCNLPSAASRPQWGPRPITYIIVYNTHKDKYKVSINIKLEPFIIIAEHLVLIFFIFFLSHLPQKPSTLGVPIELPHPRIISLDLILF